MNKEEQLERIGQARKTKIEHIARELNSIIVLDECVWELILYSALSPFAPKFLVSGVPARAVLHTMLLGEVATAKSKVFGLIEALAPKSYSITRSTLPSLEGVATAGEIKEGVVDRANNGVLVIKEFREVDQSFLRELMDCSTIKIEKRGFVKEIDVNVALLVGVNPREDFFERGTILRQQVDFQEGLLRRFDVLILLLSTTEKNAALLNMMELFGGNPLTNDFKETLATLATGMEEIKRVCLSDEYKERLKRAFIDLNTDLNGMPLLTLRDLETLCRLVNVIATANFYQREVKNSVLTANDQDVENAVSLWETLIDLRRKLYTSTERHITTIEDTILELLKNGEMTATELKDAIVGRGLCSSRTVERKVNRFVEYGVIAREGKERNPTLSVCLKKSFREVGVDACGGEPT